MEQLSATITSVFKRFWQPFLLATAIVFLYATILFRLVQVWWTDENYSHGLLIPLLIVFLLWSEKKRWAQIEKRSNPLLGGTVIAAAVLLLFLGTLGAELFTQRVSFVVLLAGVAVYFFGRGVWRFLLVPFVLLLLAIPIPTVLWNQIAFPLQLLATDLAVWVIRLFAIPVAKFGNIIELLPQGAVQTVQFEVVEACSGIRSLMTLATLALVYTFFTRRNYNFERLAVWRNFDFWRAAFLIAAALPIAVLTNAARIVGTIVLARFYGKEVADGFLHDFSGWLVYLFALASLLAADRLIGLPQKWRRTERNEKSVQGETLNYVASRHRSSPFRFLILMLFLLVSGAFVHWRETAGETLVARKSLRDLPEKLGRWQKFGDDTRFGAEIESVLRADDYLMRDYVLQASGRTANIYVGYYNTQRTGATYHSPRNCLPGSGWTMREPEIIEITLPDGRNLTANSYVIENNAEKMLMIYWYQGRGRFVANEYRDKFLTVWDSIGRRRSDGALVRIVTSLKDSEKDADDSNQAAADLSAQLAAKLSDFVPN